MPGDRRIEDLQRDVMRIETKIDHLKLLMIGPRSCDEAMGPHTHGEHASDRRLLEPEELPFPTCLDEAGNRLDGKPH